MERWVAMWATDRTLRCDKCSRGTCAPARAWCRTPEARWLEVVLTQELVARISTYLVSVRGHRIARVSLASRLNPADTSTEYYEASWRVCAWCFARATRKSANARTPTTLTRFFAAMRGRPPSMRALTAAQFPTGIYFANTQARASMRHVARPSTLTAMPTPAWMI